MGASLLALAKSIYYVYRWESGNTVYSVEHGRLLCILALGDIIIEQF